MKSTRNRSSVLRTGRFILSAAKRSVTERFRSGELKWDLGLRKLWPEWKDFFSVDGIREDLLSGLILSSVAIPLSLAIALESKVDPGAGLVSAIVAGIVCALFGGSKFSVSGPANAMPILIAYTVEQFGVQGLLFVGIVCGVLQILGGLIGLGKLFRYIPFPLVAGFTAGIGAIIFVGQLPRALGLEAPPAGDIWTVLSHLGQELHDSKPLTVVIALITIAISQLLPKMYPKLPASLLAIVVPTVLVSFAEWNVPTIGVTPHNLPWPHFPGVPSQGIGGILEASILIFGLASLETLLTSSAIDRLVPGEKHDPDQELIGQGLGNVAVALFGGIPVTGVIARSTLNVKSGAKSRRASIFHALFIWIVIVGMASWIDAIPIAALSGILLSIALNMMNPKSLFKMWKNTPAESIVYWVTFATVVLVDLVAGAQMGIFAALLLALWNLGKAQVFFHATGSESMHRVSLAGNLTFLSTRNFDFLRKKVARMGQLASLVIDMGEVRLIDSTGAAFLIDFIKELNSKGIKVVLKSLNRDCRDVLSSADSEGVTRGSFVTSESDIANVLDSTDSYSPRSRLLFGVEQYRKERRKAYEELFNQLGQQQKPHTLFITCSDSRINPTLITSSEPGELFIVRNVGNIIPPLGADQMPAEGAAVEFALGALGVRQIILCGHTRCGALKGAFDGIDSKKFPSVAKWVEPVVRERKLYPDINDPEMFTRVHVIEQAKNLLTYPVVDQMVREEKLSIHCWIYDVQSGEFFEWTGQGREFLTVGPNSLHGNLGDIFKV
ncbi:MAG: STAS domain-containing protein [Proteobacteria bacterium]|nr:STAS domain-containing protein [Pseudomonadota bacterium]